MAIELPPDAKIVVGYAESISATLLAGGTVAGIAVIVRVLGYDKFKWHDVEIPLSYTAAIIGLGTIAHVFWVRFLILHLSKLVSINDQNPNQDIFQAVFDDIRSKKTLFLRNMISRSKQISDGSHLWRMSGEDPTTWLAYSLALLTFVAILPWRIDHGLRWAEPRWVIVAYGVIGLILVAINWWVGGLWIINLSRMKDDPDVRESLRIEIGSSSGFSIPLMGDWYGALMVLVSAIIAIIGIGFAIVMPAWWLWILLGSLGAIVWVVGILAFLVLVGAGNDSHPS
jgi:hypothetical protein